MPSVYISISLFIHRHYFWLHSNVLVSMRASAHNGIFFEYNRDNFSATYGILMKAERISVMYCAPRLRISCCVQTRKMFKGQLCDLPNRFPGLVHLDLSNYAWLTDSEMIGLQVSQKEQSSNIIPHFE